MKSKSNSRVALLLLLCAVVVLAGSNAVFCADTGEMERQFPGVDEVDLWFIAGQSNLLGLCANMKEPFDPDPRIWFFTSENEWKLFQEPLIFYSFPHGSDDSEKEMYREKGACPAFPFAREVMKYTDRPIGFIDTDTGGTMVKVWNPDLEPEKRPANYIYKRMIEHIRKANAFGRLKGVIWYQGESDVLWYPSDVVHYEEMLHRFVDRIREDTQNPDLPFFLVQISRLTTEYSHGPGTSYSGEEVENQHETYTEAWNLVQEVQRQLPQKRDHVYVVSAVDLKEMADAIHLDYESQHRLGRRLAEVVLNKVYGIPGHATPVQLDSVECTGDTIRVQFEGVNGRLTARGAPKGFSLDFSVNIPQEAEAVILPAISSVKLDSEDPSAIIIECSKTLKPEWKPSLYYGYGLNPDCNIVDEKDIPVPAFGPVRIELD